MRKLVFEKFMVEHEYISRTGEESRSPYIMQMVNDRAA
jgi:hypothetical protein